MPMSRETERRIWLTALLLSSLAGVVIWYVERLAAAPTSQWWAQTVAHFSFFTISTNSLIVIMAAVLLFGRGRLHGWFSSPSIQAAFSLYIAFVGLGFWLLLGGSRGMVTLMDWIPEICAHSLSPILGAVYFLRAVPKGSLTWADPVRWLIYPVLYLVYWLFHGPRVGYYPYFFVDVNAIGYGGVALWSLALIVFLLLLGALMVSIDHWLGKATAQSAPVVADGVDHAS